VILFGEVARVVSVADRPELDAGILVCDVVQSLASEGGGRDDPVAVGQLVGARNHTLLHEVDKLVREQLRVCAEACVLSEQVQDLVRDRTETGL